MASNNEDTLARKLNELMAGTSRRRRISDNGDIRVVRRSSPGQLILGISAATLLTAAGTVYTFGSNSGVLAAEVHQNTRQLLADRKRMDKHSIKLDALPRQFIPRLELNTRFNSISRRFQTLENGQKEIKTILRDIERNIRKP